MTQTEFNNIINSDPHLTSEGKFLTFQASDPYFQEFRDRLYGQYDEACACVDFLTLCYRLKRKRNESWSILNTSYYIRDWYIYHFGLKYDISEGALLVAAIHLNLYVNTTGAPEIAIGRLPIIPASYWDTSGMRRIGVFVIS